MIPVYSGGLETDEDPVKKSGKMKSYFWRRLFGFRYLVNVRSGEVHDLANQKVNCLIHMMKDDNKMFVRKKKLKQMIDSSDFYNGCRWCNKDLDTD